MIEALLMFASAAVQADVDAPMIPAFFTGERLYEICTGTNEPQCWMYVAGVLDGIFHAEAAQDRTLCRAEISNREAAELVTEYLRNNAAMRSKAAAVSVEHALKSKLACNPETA